MAFLVMLFLETFIVVSVSYREKKTQNKAMNIHETIYISHAEKAVSYTHLKQEISLENIAEIKAALGNVAYTFFDENNNMLFHFFLSLCKHLISPCFKQSIKH